MRVIWETAEHAVGYDGSIPARTDSAGEATN